MQCILVGECTHRVAVPGALCESQGLGDEERRSWPHRPPAGRWGSLPILSGRPAIGDALMLCCHLCKLRLYARDSVLSPSLLPRTDTARRMQVAEPPRTQAGMQTMPAAMRLPCRHTFHRPASNATALPSLFPSPRGNPAELRAQPCEALAHRVVEVLVVVRHGVEGELEVHHPERVGTAY
jgi:hypothetical protein